jgi:exonuclease SbcD
VRFVHTSDWHLGKRLCEANLLEDQAHALDQLYALCRDERADALVIAGDLYDRAVPPTEAVSLLSDFMARVTRALSIPIIAVAGNHDSPERLGFGAEILERGKIFLRTQFSRRAEPITVGVVPFYCLPYLEPEVARAQLEDDTLTTHDAAIRAAFASMHAHRQKRPAVLVGHLFAQGGRETAASERPLVVGGAAQVAVDAFDGWGYVALGHLHEPQTVGGRNEVRYSGSLLKYSFDEAHHEKTVELVEVTGGPARVRRIALSPRRDVVRLEGTFDELLAHPRFSFAEGAYVEATYTDSGYLIDVAPRLRARFPHLLIARPKQLVARLHVDTKLRAIVQASSTGRELLESFWKHVEGDAVPLDDAHLQAFEEALEAARREDEVTLEAQPPAANEPAVKRIVPSDETELEP